MPVRIVLYKKGGRASGGIDLIRRWFVSRKSKPATISRKSRFDFSGRAESTSTLTENMPGCFRQDFNSGKGPAHAVTPDATSIARCGVRQWPLTRLRLTLDEQRMSSCPFCDLDPTSKWIENDHALAIPDAYPLADGHTLVVPRKHVSSIYALTAEEQAAIWSLAR